MLSKFNCNTLGWKTVPFILAKLAKIVRKNLYEDSGESLVKVLVKRNC